MKTNFISNLKRIAFLALAVFGTFVGYSQSPQNPSIGGSKTPSTDPFGDFYLNIGGSQGAPRDTSGGLIVLSLENKTNCIFAYPNEIGGKGTGTSSDTGQFDDDDFDPYDIGGGKSSDGGLGLYGLIDIGGQGSTGGGKGTSTDTGQFDDDSDPFDIGGRGQTGTGEFAYLSDIGGKGTSGGDTGQRTDPDYIDPLDTGGVVIGRPMIALEYIPGVGCLVDTGGRDSGGGLITGQNADIGGGKSSDTGTGLRTVADTGGRNGHGTGTSTGGDYDDNDDDDTGGRGSNGTTGEVSEIYAWLSTLN